MPPPSSEPASGSGIGTLCGLKVAEQKETGGGLIHLLQTISRLWIIECFLSWIFGWRVGWAPLCEPECLSSLLHLTMPLGDLCPGKEEVAVKSPSSCCPWLPTVDQLPVHWLVSPAAAGELQQGFSKDFLNSVSCGVTIPVPLLPLLVLLFLHTGGDHEVGELTTDPWNQLLSFLLGRQRKSQRRWLLSYRGCHSHLTSTACHLPEWQKVGSICLLQCDWITKKQLADGKFIFQDTYNNHHQEDTGANLDANGIAQLELITEGSGFLYAQFHSYVSS